MTEKLGRVFMLDDDLIVLNLYREMLEKIGYEVFATANAYQFLLYAKELMPDLFILDINMPEITGWEVMNRLAAEDRTSEIPVIVMSVLADKALAVQKGAAHYLNKPVKLEDLLEILEAYCIGNKKHDVLLLEDFEPMKKSLRQRMEERKWSCFEVNDLKAAKRYLQKNNPKVVVVNLPKNRLGQVLNELKHPLIRYLESYEQVDVLEELLK